MHLMGHFWHVFGTVSGGEFGAEDTGTAAGACCADRNRRQAHRRPTQAFGDPNSRHRNAKREGCAGSLSAEMGAEVDAWGPRPPGIEYWRGKKYAATLGRAPATSAPG